ncbi:hypothetical protein F7984_14530 [Pradoshia sp. D12]|nr:hypothetical protein [Bacillus sp. D12]QFK72370.1 hypothetical protein F7984_14530 [Pradoshia sp. D12]TPF71137.1 hypothetical protein FHY44_11665 [Bacillus sp. D12]
MTVRMEPTKEQVSIWIENFVPKKDLFFVEEKDLDSLVEYLCEVLVVPGGEFFKHPSYKQIQLVNSYMYWNISSKAQFVIVAKPDWITNLPEQKKRDIVNIQYKMNRGLILPLSLFASASSIPQEYIVEENDKKFFVIQRSIWNRLSYQIKERAILAYAQQWDDWFGIDFPEQTPIHIKKYANKFPMESGSNCLSATLFAITEQDWIIDEWVHPNTFLNGLERANFSLINDVIKKGDIITWVNQNGVIKHAAYHIDNNLFFNKNGQTFFNPWKITDLNKLNEEWYQYKMKVYRKM